MGISLYSIPPFLFRRFSLTSFIVGLLFYFAYHAVNGERGLLALINLTQQVEKAQNDLDLTRAERLYLEHRVQLLRPNSLDLDLLEEQARKYLGYAKATEQIYFLDKNS